MNRATVETLVAGTAGCLFGAGLVLSGMTDPRKVLGFLDVLGTWDASLLWVMAGAVAVHTLGYRLIVRRASPLLSGGFAIPTRRDIDAKLLLGAALFGIGWGLSGYCPGPSLVALPSAQSGVFYFVLAYVAGTLFTIRLESWRSGAGWWGSAEQSRTEVVSTPSEATREPPAR